MPLVSGSSVSELPFMVVPPRVCLSEHWFHNLCSAASALDLYVRLLVSGLLCQKLASLSPYEKLTALVAKTMVPWQLSAKGPARAGETWYSSSLLALSSIHF